MWTAHEAPPRTPRTRLRQASASPVLDLDYWHRQFSRVRDALMPFPHAFEAVMAAIEAPIPAPA